MSDATNRATIENFYRAFAARDYATMAASYADDASFADPVFPGLTAEEARAMWEMFCVRGSDLEVTSSDVRVDGDRATAQWEARYKFGATGRSVHNVISASFELADGKVVTHRDSFDFYRWTRMALGPLGTALGWTPHVRNKVRRQARGQLERFMQQRQS